MIRTVKPVKAHMLQGGHKPKAGKRFCPKISVYRSKAYTLKILIIATLLFATLIFANRDKNMKVFATLIFANA